MYRLPTAAFWVLVFAGVLGHFPGLGFDFAGADFEALARGAGLSPSGSWPVFPWTDLGVWSLWWRISGADPSIPHATGVLLVALNAVLVSLVGARIGLSRAGAILAAALWLLGPGTSVAVAWTSASAELWTLLFALAGLRLWMGTHPRRDPPLGALLLLLAVASGPGALLLAPAYFAAWWWFGPTGESPAVRRGRLVLLSIVLGFGLLTAWRTATAPATGLPAASILPSGAGPIPSVFVRLGLAAWIWPFAPAAGVLAALGLGVGLGAVALLVAKRQRPAPRLRFAVLWIVAAILPVAVLPERPTLLGTLAPAVGLAWAAGTFIGPSLEAGLTRVRPRVRNAGSLALILLLVVVGPGWGLVRTAALARTGSEGRPGADILRSAAITAGVRHEMERVMSTPTPPPQIAFLQATRLQIEAPDRIPEGREVILASPVYRALEGATGPRLMLAGRATVRWTTLLDEVSGDAFVFLDAGDGRVRPLGPVENARIYAALIAVAAGQFDLARHEFWSVIEHQGAQVRFAFDPDHMPIRPEELDAGAAGFARGLKSEGSAPALRVLRLFASVYESVRGQPLIEEGLGGPLRSGRVDD